LEVSTLARTNALKGDVLMKRSSEKPKGKSVTEKPNLQCRFFV